VTTGARPVFVVELPEVPKLAFAAEHEAQAMSFASTAWFRDALGNYLQAKASGATNGDA
jgi:hypothetical protein